MEIMRYNSPMLKSRYFLPSFLTLVIVALLHWIASDYGYYWTVDWYDIMMHFLGGLWTALFVIWISDSFPSFGLGRFISLRNILLWTIAVGVAWEVFELVMGFSDLLMSDYWSDSILDLIMDTIGGFAAFKVFKK